MDAPLVPAYGETTLCEVVPALAARLGVPGYTDVLGLPGSERYVLMMIDGLGELPLRARAERAPFLSGLLDAGGALSLTSGVPSTTATSLTSLGTGLTPGQHGIAGYSFRHPFSGGLLNALLWEDGLAGIDVQPQLTQFERLARAGVSVSMVAPTRFRGSGLTEAALRGAHFWPVSDEGDLERRVMWGVQASGVGARTLVYFYERHLDHTGHGRGWQSGEWADALAHVDTLASGLRSELPDDVRLIITGDHGMMDAPPERQYIVEDEPGLLADVDLFAGEGRLRQLYTSEPAAVASRWLDRFGDRAWIRTRDEAIDEGWFGPVWGRLASRFGDVLVAMASDEAVMTLAHPRELSLIGMHGSLTPAEMRVPVLVA